MGALQDGSSDQRQSVCDGDGAVVEIAIVNRVRNRVDRRIAERDGACGGVDIGDLILQGRIQGGAQAANHIPLLQSRGVDIGDHVASAGKGTGHGSAVVVEPDGVYLGAGCRGTGIGGGTQGSIGDVHVGLPVGRCALDGFRTGAADGEIVRRDDVVTCGVHEAKVIDPGVGKINRGLKGGAGQNHLHIHAEEPGKSDAGSAGAVGIFAEEQRTAFLPVDLGRVVDVLEGKDGIH